MSKGCTCVTATAGFDPQARREFHDLLLDLTKQDRTTILRSTHDLGEAEKLAHRILILNHGQIIADGTSAELAGGQLPLPGTSGIPSL